jgi:hypothetical protein
MAPARTNEAFFARATILYCTVYARYITYVPKNWEGANRTGNEIAPLSPFW